MAHTQQAINFNLILASKLPTAFLRMEYENGNCSNGGIRSVGS